MSRASRPGAVALRTVLPSLALNGAIPLLVYLLLQPHLPGDAAALAVAMAVPVACTVAIFAWRRRVDAIGAIAVVTFGIALLVVLLSGGNAFVLKLQEAVVTGPLGLLLLGSAAVRKPVLLAAARLLSRGERTENALAEARRRQASTVLTAILGGTLTVHAAVLTVFALVLSTAQVLAVSRLVGLSILGAGLLVLLAYRGRLQKAAK